MTDVRYEGHYDQEEVYMSIVSAVETIGIEGEGILPLRRHVIFVTHAILDDDLWEYPLLANDGYG
jgi:hypothetical protein